MQKRPELLSYRMRISLAMVLFAIIPFLIMLLFYINAEEPRLSQAALSQHTQMLEVYGEQLNRGFQKLETTALYVKNNATVRNFLNRMQGLEMPEKLQFASELQELDSALSVDNSGLQLRWYSDYSDFSYGGYCYTTEDLAEDHAGNRQDLARILELGKNETLTLIRQPMDGNKEHVVSVYTKISNINGTDHILEVSMPIVDMVYPDQFELSGEYLVGICFSQGDEQQIVTILGGQEKAQASLEEYYTTGKSEEYYPLEIALETEPEGVITCLIQEAYVWELFWTSRIPVIILGLGVIVMVLVCSYITSRLLTRKVMHFIAHIDDELSHEQTDPEAAKDEGKDLSDIAKRVRELLERSREQGKQLEAAKLEKKRMELELLQMRFNPHFLYNTLGSIRYQVKEPRIRKSIDSLIAYYRIVLSKGSLLISIASEIQMIKEYLNLEIFAFDLRNVECVFEIDEQVRDLLIVKHLLQPIVENAMEHGVRTSEKLATITVRARLDEKNVIIEVEDTGVGMTAEQIETITTTPNGNLLSGGYGVYNVIQRIKTYYGPEYGVTFNSEPGKGTLVTITIPQMNMSDRRND